MFALLLFLLYCYFLSKNTFFVMEFCKSYCNINSFRVLNLLHNVCPIIRVSIYSLGTFKFAKRYQYKLTYYIKSWRRFYVSFVLIKVSYRKCFNIIRKYLWNITISIICMHHVVILHSLYFFTHITLLLFKRDAHYDI